MGAGLPAQTELSQVDGWIARASGSWLTGETRGPGTNARSSGMGCEITFGGKVIAASEPGSTYLSCRDHLYRVALVRGGVSQYLPFSSVLEITDVVWHSSHINVTTCPQMFSLCIFFLTESWTYRSILLMARTR